MAPIRQSQRLGVKTGFSILQSKLSRQLLFISAVGRIYISGDGKTFPFPSVLVPLAGQIIKMT